MDLAREIMRSREGAASSIAAERRRARENLKALDRGPTKRSTKLRLVEQAVPAASFNRALLSEIEESEEANKPAPPRPGLFKRIRSRLRRWWSGAGRDDTHRFRRRVDVKTFDHIPRKIDELFEEDEKGKPFDRVSFVRARVERHETCRFVQMFYVGGIILVELKSGAYAVVGIDDIEQL